MKYLAENPQVVITLIIGVVGLIITWWFSQNNLKIAHQKMEKELFSEFNKKYDELNDKLKVIFDNTQVNDKTTLNGLKKLNFKIKEEEIFPEIVLIDYFNLCAEEYYWRNKKRVSKKIWLSWQAGMKSYYRYCFVRELWEKEVSDFGYQSYYLKEGQSFFDDKIKTPKDNSMV